MGSPAHIVPRPVPRTTGVPVDVALTLAWPALSGLLAYPALAARLSELVHAAHAVVPARRGRRSRASAGSRRLGSWSWPHPAGAPTAACAATRG